MPNTNKEPTQNPKRDTAIQLTIGLMAKELNGSKPESILWVADEHPIKAEDLTPLKGSAIKFISNRIDPIRLAQSSGFDTEFSDFAFDTTTKGSIDQLFFRVAKERAVVHRVINQAFNRLKIGGTLWLIGFKNEGIKTHISKASRLFGSKAKVSKGKNQISAACIVKASDEGQSLEDDDYGQLRQLPFTDNQTFWTKPGIYGWDKVDPGSLFLKEILSKKFTGGLNDSSDKQVLDLGCGYGYLSCYLAELKPKKIVATDNCIAAIQATEKNLQNLGNKVATTSKVITSNAGDSLLADGSLLDEGSVNEKFDLVISNPPFHQGFATSDELHIKFLQNTKRLLKPDGQAWYVVNQFLPLEKHCKSASLQCKEIARNNSFKVFLITH